MLPLPDVIPRAAHRRAPRSPPPTHVASNHVASLRGDSARARASRTSARGAVATIR